MKRPSEIIKALTLHKNHDYGYEVSYRECRQLVDYIHDLEKVLDEASSELEEYTYLKCECHCGGGCYNENKEECDDVCFFKHLQTAQQWKEYFLKDE